MDVTEKPERTFWPTQYNYQNSRHQEGKIVNCCEEFSKTSVVFLSIEERMIDINHKKISSPQ